MQKLNTIARRRLEDWCVVFGNEDRILRIRYQYIYLPSRPPPTKQINSMPSKMGMRNPGEIKIRLLWHKIKNKMGNKSTVNMIGFVHW